MRSESRRRGRQSGGSGASGNATRRRSEANHRPGPVDAAWRSWLATPGSLTARLRQHADRFEVQVLHDGPARWLPGERLRVTGSARPARAHVREVALRLDGVACVLARSVASPAARVGPWRALHGLGSRPLAELLFGTPHLTRGRLRVDRLPTAGPWRARIEGLQAGAGLSAGARGAPVRWARSRVFERHGQRLVVMEMFLPALRQAVCTR